MDLTIHIFQSNPGRCCMLLNCRRGTFKNWGNVLVNLRFLVYIFLFENKQPLIESEDNVLKQYPSSFGNDKIFFVILLRNKYNQNEENEEV